MSTIKSSTDHLTLNADGASKDIKFQANGVEKASISSAGVMTATSFAGSGAALTNLPGGDNKASFQARRASGLYFNDNTFTKVTGFTEDFDTDNNFSSDRFTPTTAGKYSVNISGDIEGVTAYDMYNGHIELRKNGVAFKGVGSQGNLSYRSHRYGLGTQIIVDMNGSTDYLEMWVYLNNSGSAQGWLGNASFGAFKLIT